MKKLVVLLVMLFSVFVLVGCGGNEIDKNFEDLTDQIENLEEQVTVKFRVPSGVIAEALPDLITSFNEKYPKVKIETDIVSEGYDGVRRLTILDIQNNRAPVMVVGYPDHLAEYHDGNWLIDLQWFIEGKNGYTQDELDDFVQSYLDEGRGFDAENPNDLYSLPLNKSTEVLVYNKTMMDALHEKDSSIVVPKTWQELKTISDKIIDLVEAGEVDDVIQLAKGEKKPSELLKDGLFVPFAYDSTDNAFITFTRQWNGAYTEKASNTKGYIKFDHANNVKFLEYFQAEAEAGRFSIAETFNASYASDAFKVLKTLMTVGSSAGVGYNKPTGNKFELGVAEIPYNAENPEGKYVIQQGTNIAILGQSTNLQRSAAWLFIQHLLTTENSAKFAMSTGGYLPVRNSSYDTQEYIEYLQTPPLEKMTHAKAAKVGLSYIENGYKFFVDPAFVGSSGIRDEVGLLFSAVVVNKRNIQQRITEAYANIGNAYVNEEK